MSAMIIIWLSILIPILWAFYEVIQVSDIKTVSVVDHKVITKRIYQHNGFSYGTKGDLRSYWGAKDVVDRVYVLFYVTYNKGYGKYIKTYVGSQKYKKLMAYVLPQEKMTARKAFAKLSGGWVLPNKKNK